MLCNKISELSLCYSQSLILTLFRALPATPQILAQTDSEYKADRPSLKAGDGAVEFGREVAPFSSGFAPFFFVRACF
jgi:hypothetical protein